jgi:hypothetical protein
MEIGYLTDVLTGYARQIRRIQYCADTELEQSSKSKLFKPVPRAGSWNTLSRNVERGRTEQGK